MCIGADCGRCAALCCEMEVKACWRQESSSEAVGVGKRGGCARADDLDITVMRVRKDVTAC